eukprot:CAMPEP_0115282416 /NCGR_PEP_ID=MMETSP0270-20121206/59831_1 /TAXON_ID=71861 /ORGANISM="Scrippsiella trochoidea, Strain CCMP3099" /LENGTH=375 /DNA_ID=CAMNT_0002699261 /DNA_START=236 /DNA_END=1363 /DNA_ORIENTATION=+
MASHELRRRVRLELQEAAHDACLRRAAWLHAQARLNGLSRRFAHLCSEDGVDVDVVVEDALARVLTGSNDSITQATALSQSLGDMASDEACHDKARRAVSDQRLLEVAPLAPSCPPSVPLASAGVPADIAAAGVIPDTHRSLQPFSPRCRPGVAGKRGAAAAPQVADGFGHSLHCASATSLAADGGHLVTLPGQESSARAPSLPSPEIAGNPVKAVSDQRLAETVVSSPSSPQSVALACSGSPADIIAAGVVSDVHRPTELHTLRCKQGLAGKGSAAIAQQLAGGLDDSLHSASSTPLAAAGNHAVAVPGEQPGMHAASMPSHSTAGTPRLSTKRSSSKGLAAAPVHADEGTHCRARWQKQHNGRVSRPRLEGCQ